MPEDAQEESLLILAEVTPDATPELAEQIASAVVARTNVRPHRVLLVEPGTLPRTSSGKLRRQEALRRFLAGALTAPRAVNAMTVGVELLRSAVAHARRTLT
jgi:acyl-coenzyme A synthetase/AMP-(fatty) acid ligase